MKKTDSGEQLRMTVYASLFAALTAAGAYIALPVGPVPIVLQNFFVLLSGLLLGGKWGTACIGVYLLAGALGLPVFAVGKGGIGHIAGPTGGYLLGYLPAVYLVGMISNAGKGRWIWDVAAMILGSTVIYACGATWLKLISGMPMDKAMALGVYPFLIGDAAKIAAAIPVSRALRPFIRLHENA